MKKMMLLAMIVAGILAGAMSSFAQAANGLSYGGTYSFESFNYPGEYIRHQNGVGEKSRITSDPDRKDASFRMVRGLAGTCYSLESVNFPGEYLRHQDSRIKLNRDDGTDLFRKDATFCARNGLANAEDVSFETSNYPGFFLTHNNGHLFIERRQDALFAKDATFKIRPALWQTSQGASASPQLLSPAAGAVLMNGCSTTALDYDTTQEFTWAAVPGATQYHLYVKQASAPNPFVNAQVGATSYSKKGKGTSYVQDSYRTGWSWKVRAMVNGQWGAWGEERSFGYEAMNTHCPKTIKFFNQGGYVARYVLSYTLNGQQKVENSGDKAIGQSASYEIHPDARNINVKGFAYTGLIWAPEKAIFDLSVSATSNICLKSYGTTLNPSYNNNCN